MAQVTYRDLNEQIDINKVIEKVRGDWEKSRRAKRSIEQWIITLIPVGLVLMAIIFYALSAPHTAEILNLVTPGFGVIAPVGWELGIVIISALREARYKNFTTGAILYMLLFMSIVINVAGAFITVVSSGSEAGIETATFLDLTNRFSSLPAKFQVVLLLIIPIGAVIPIIGKLSGETIIKLALGQIQLQKEDEEIRWDREKSPLVRTALFNVAKQKGAPIKTAGNWANQIIFELFGTEVGTVPTENVSQTKISVSQTVPLTSSVGTGLGQVDSGTEVGTGLKLSQKEVIEWLRQHPERLSESDRDIARAFTVEMYGIASDAGYKTVQRARAAINKPL